MSRFIRITLVLCLVSLPVTAFAQWATNAGNTTTNDNVGIDTAAPTAKLEISSAGTTAFKTNGWAVITGGVYVDSNVAAGISGTNGNLLFRAGGVDSRMVLDTNGQLGIGGITPSARLHINGITRAEDRVEVRKGGSDLIAEGSGFFLGDTVGDWIGMQMSANKSLDFWTQNSGWFRRMSITPTGNVGIGTASPGVKLEISSGNTTAFKADGWAISAGWYTQADLAAGLNSSNGKLAFRAGGNDSRMVIDTNGQVGIGTITPTATLEVNGTIKATSVIGSVYQDLAEWVPATQNMVAGTVVVIADTHNTVAPSQGAYDTRVAGVVSEQPGLLLGVAGTSKEMIATTGRVKVRVDASRGPIRPGDLLVTSDRAGIAMRSEPVDMGGVKIHRPGTLIGKALEPLERGEGEILVLLSLQ